MNKRFLIAMVFIPLIVVLAAGCSRHTPREIDISQGEYYEDEEYQKLSKSQREEYCADLATELETLDERSESAQAELEQNKEDIQRLTRELGVNLAGVQVILGLLRKIEDLQGETRELRRTVQRLKASPAERPQLGPATATPTRVDIE